MKFNEKLRLVRKTIGLTQDKFSSQLGISRGNLANIELGKIEPTHVLINCVSLMFNVDKQWLINDDNSDTSILKSCINVSQEILVKYEQLSEKNKWFINQQIDLLLKIQ